MISIEQLTVRFGGFTLLDNISFVINKKDRIALVGKNGAGKSTLMKIIAGMQAPAAGAVNIPKDMTVGYLPQEMQLADTRTVIAEAEQAFEHIHQTEAEIDRINGELAERTDYDSDSYGLLIERVATLSEQLQMNGANYHAELERTLIGLGFMRSDFDRPTSEFSGGWRMRIELAKLLLRRPDVLLLDEPTNHLDIESVQWLETFIATHANAVILVSHDRAFINNTTQRTLEIELGRIYDYKVKYDEYVVLRRERREQQLRAYENQRKQIEETEDFIERFRYKATKAVQVQSRIKQLEKIERIEVDDEDNAALRLKFPPAPRSGSFPIIAEEVKKAYGDHIVFANATFTVNRGDKVAFVGKNGEGKSTFVKCIMGEIEFEGNLQLGHNVKIGYFAQNQADLMDGSRTVFETVDYVATGDVRTKIRDILGAFMFGGEASDKKVAVLSGGERTRLAMIKLLLEPVNLLILDEPTNHLDMRSKDILKDALKEFDGTAIIVSHDRDFLNGLVDKVYEFGGQKIREHLGGIYEFLEHKKIENLDELSSAPRQSAPTMPASSGKQSDNRQAMKEQQRRAKRLEKTVAELESQIESLEKETKEIESVLSTPEGAANVELIWKHADLQKQIADAMSRWEVATTELEEAALSNP